MIYFYQNLVKEAIRTIEDAHELVDIKNDVTEIDAAVYKIKNHMNYENLQVAQELDKRPRDKYSTINLMLTVADRMLPLSSNVGNSQLKEISEISHLTQDKCGILCHVLLKKEIISRVEDFIEKVG